MWSFNKIYGVFSLLFTKYVVISQFFDNICDCFAILCKICGVSQSFAKICDIFRNYFWRNLGSFLEFLTKYAFISRSFDNLLYLRLFCNLVIKFVVQILSYKVTNLFCIFQILLSEKPSNHFVTFYRFILFLQRS